MEGYQAHPVLLEDRGVGVDQVGDALMKKIVGDAAAAVQVGYHRRAAEEAIT